MTLTLPTTNDEQKTTDDGEVLVRVEGVSKRFCRSLKKSLWYGVQDIAQDLNPFSRSCSNQEQRTEEPKLRSEEFWAVKDVSFELRRGECLGLIGHNGAGKTTLLKMLNGLIKPDSGRITMRGRVGALIALGAGFNPILTGRENIGVNGSVLGLSKREIDEKTEEIIQFAGVGKFIDSPVQNYSSGMQVRLGFAVATALNPQILIVDEVLAVGDVQFRMKCFERIATLKKNGVSICLVTHNMIDVARICNRAILLVNGSKAFAGGVSEGIAAYEETALLAQSKCNGSEEMNFKNQAWFESVDILDSESTQTKTFKTGDDVVVNLYIRGVDRIRNARIIVHVESVEAGILGSFSTPYSNFCFDIERHVISIQLLLKNIPLCVGSYRLRFSIYGPSISDFYCERSGREILQIVAPAVDGFGYGIAHSILFDHEWKLLSYEK